MLNTLIERPIFEPIPYRDPAQYALCFQTWDNWVFLDSARAHKTLGRYSFIAIDPFATLNYSAKNAEERAHCPDVFARIADQLSEYPLKPCPDLPPFQGGIAGFFSYDLARSLEKLPETACDDKHYPDLTLGFYDVVLSFDNLLKKAWIVSSGFPEIDPFKRKLRAEARLQWGLSQIASIPKAPAYPSCFSEAISSNFTRRAYLKAVARVIEHIRAGDIFEANISQRFQCTLNPALSPFALYLRLRESNPAPVGAYLRFHDTTLLSTSPERFLKLSKGWVEARPIKGTSQRSKNPDEDRRLAHALKQSEKDRAENTMVVDLMRNDLSKVCTPGTVKVSRYCGLESYETVHHLVSVIEGKLQEDLGSIDVLKAAFPGGSVTGAPKVRAMEIIEALEPARRGPYCGSMGYIGFDGSMDLSILIRTCVLKEGVLTFQAGGAIVLDSDPEAEYRETLLKAAPLKRVLMRHLTEIPEDDFNH